MSEREREAESRLSSGCVAREARDGEEEKGNLLWEGKIKGKRGARVRGQASRCRKRATEEGRQSLLTLRPIIRSKHYILPHASVSCASHSLSSFVCSPSLERDCRVQRRRSEQSPASPLLPLLSPEREPLEQRSHESNAARAPASAITSPSAPLP